MKEGKDMKKLYVSPKAEVVCYSAPDIISVSAAVRGTPQTFSGDGNNHNEGVIQFGNLHK